MKATKDNYTHVIFHYRHGGKMTLNKHTHINVFPNEENIAERVEYLIKDEINTPKR